MIRDIPDDMPVKMYRDSVIGGFLFCDVCPTDSGVIGLPEPDQATGEIGAAQTIFAIMPHGVTATEEEIESGNGPKPDILN